MREKEKREREREKVIEKERGGAKTLIMSQRSLSTRTNMALEAEQGRELRASVISCAKRDAFFRFKETALPVI